MKLLFFDGVLLREDPDFHFDQNGILKIDTRVVEGNVLVAIDTDRSEMKTYHPRIKPGISEPMRTDGGLKEDAFYWEHVPENRGFTQSEEELPDQFNQ